MIKIAALIFVGGAVLVAAAAWLIGLIEEDDAEFHAVLDPDGRVIAVVRGAESGRE